MLLRTLPIAAILLVAIVPVLAQEPPSSEVLAQSFVDALQTKDLDTVGEMLHDDAVLTMPFTGDGRTTVDAMRVFDGKAAVLGYFTGASQRIEKVSFTDLELVTSMDNQTVFAEMRGDMVLPNGEPYRNLYVWRIDFRGDVIVNIREYFNPITANIAFDRS